MRQLFAVHRQHKNNPVHVKEVLGGFQELDRIRGPATVQFINHHQEGFITVGVCLIWPDAECYGHVFEFRFEFPDHCLSLLVFRQSFFGSRVDGLFIQICPQLGRDHESSGHFLHRVRTDMLYHLYRGFLKLFGVFAALPFTDTFSQFGAERHKRVLGEIRFPGIELDDGKLLVLQVLRPHLEKRGFAGPPGGIHGQDVGPLVSADQAGERFHRFSTVQQVVLERVIFGDFDGLGLYAVRYHCLYPDCPLKGIVNGPQYNMGRAGRRRLYC